MKAQKHYSMAIQALNERRDKLVIDNGGLTDAGQYALAIQECNEAITYLEGMKVISSLIGDFKDCKFTLELKENDG